MVLKGTIIGESLVPGARIEGLVLRVSRIRRGGPAELSAAQLAAGIPRTWTLIEFEADETEADRLTGLLSASLDTGGWYVDFHSPTTTYVVFKGRVFGYRRGDRRGRNEVIAHGRTLGIPDSQLDWPE
jgi:hypothetical protein